RCHSQARPARRRQGRRPTQPGPGRGQGAGEARPGTCQGTGDHRGAGGVKPAVLIVAALVASSAAARAEQSAGVVIFTAPDGSRRILSVPKAQSAAEARVPQAPETRRANLWNTVQETSNRHGLDPKLVDLVIRMESGYHPYVVSPK